MAETPKFFQSGWVKLGGAMVLSLITWYIGTRKPAEIVLQTPPEPKTTVTIDSSYGDAQKRRADSLLALLTHRKSTTDTFLMSMPDTCTPWIDYYRGLAEQLKTELEG